MAGQDEDEVVQCHEETREGSIPAFTSCRYMLAYVAMFGMLFSNAVKIDLSIALVCMVRPPSSEVVNGTNGTIEEASEGCLAQPLDNSTDLQEYEFDWSRPIQGAVLSAMFYGYILTQFPGGLLSRRFGTKKVMGVGMMLSAVATLLTPIAARTHVYFVIALRVLVGLGTGVMYPSVHHIWSRWAPPLERTKLIAFTYSGALVGNVVTFFLSGYLCKYGFDGGWPSIFYIFGGGAAIWLLFWTFLVYDTPSQHPRISDNELFYIEKSIGRLMTTKGDNKVPIPWTDFAKSRPLYAICVAHICSDWGNYTLITGLPTYMKDVLKFDMKQNGLFSALPYIGMFLLANIVGKLADTIRRRGASTTVVRKVFQALSFIIPGSFLIATGFLECDQRHIAVTFVIVAVTTTAFSRAGFLVNALDIAPSFAGILFGISNVLGTIPGLLAPLTIGNVVIHGKREEWQKVFFICAAIFASGVIVFSIFASGKEQSWSRRTHQRDEEEEANLGKDNRRSSIIIDTSI